MTTTAVVTVVMDERVNPATPMMYPAGVTVESDMKEKHPISSLMPNDGSIVFMNQQASYLDP